MPLVRRIQEFIPRLGYDHQKGDLGRIGVLGGSLDYTGAPYFAAISSLKTGSDLCHVYTVKEAAPVIKSYSPELIVHPCIDPDSITVTLETMEKLLDRIDVLIVGPGLGRNAQIQVLVREIMIIAQQKRLYLIIDADGLSIITKEPLLIQGYDRAVLTPNRNELIRLRDTLSITKQDREQCIQMISKYLKATIVSKDATDIICQGDKVIECSKQTAPRRCGGQGDILAGMLATLLAWASKRPNQRDAPYLCGYGACRLLRETCFYTFRLRKRSMVASDIIEHIGLFFGQIFEPNEQESQVS